MQTIEGEAPMDGFFSPQKIQKLLKAAVFRRRPVEIRLDDDPHVYIGYFVTHAEGYELRTQPGVEETEHYLYQQVQEMKGSFLSPVEPSFGNARIQQSSHVYVQFGLGNQVLRCMLKVVGQQPFGRVALHRLSFPEAFLSFSNRQERRNHITPETVMTALVKTPDHQKVLARVLDISSHGIAIQYPPGTRLFQRDQNVKVDLFAPATGKLSFNGRLKHYSPVPHTGSESGNFIQCGISIDSERMKKKQNKKWHELMHMVSRREEMYNKKRERHLLLLPM